MQPAIGGQPAPSQMSQAIGSPENAFGIGRAIARTFSTWWRNAIAFSVLTLVCSIPIWAFVLSSGVQIPGMNAPPQNPFAPQPQQLPQNIQGFWLAYAATLLLMLVEVGAVTYAVINDLAGKKVSLLAMIGAGAKRALPLLVVGILCYVLVVAGSILLLVPGIWLGCALSVAIPAVVVEKPGVFGALKRSFAITKGKRFSVFVIFLVFVVVMIAIVMLGGFVLPILTASFSPLLGTIVGQLVNLVFGTLFWVLPGVVYHDLRVAKEGATTAQLAAVFE
jgi:hypothetical protein